MPKALSLKYRPSKFSDLIGQDSVSKTLSLALDLNKVSHAYLFSGLRGSGKTSSARIFARALQCNKFPTSLPCGECDNCKSALNGAHMDIIEMDAASSRGIDDIKNLIEQIQYKPAYGRFKIFIIDEIHMLTKEAFNALLKTLEEPPEYVKFILATTDPLKLPATILSRTQHFRFKKIPQKAIATHLKMILGLEGVKFEDEAIDLLSRNCSGSLRDAITMLEQAIIFSKENITLGNVSSMLGSLNPSVIEEFFDAIFKKNDKRINELLAEFESYESDSVIDEMIIFLKSKLLERAYNTIVIDRFFKILGEAKMMLGYNADSSFVLLLVALKFQESLNIQEIDKVIAKIEQEMLSDIHKNLTTSAASNIQKDTESSKKSQSTQSMQSQNIIKSPYERLIDKLYDRSYELGEVFSKNVFFVSFEHNILVWESKANEQDKAMLKEYYNVILSLAKEIFGKNLVIKATSNKTQDSALNNATTQNNIEDSMQLAQVKDTQNTTLANPSPFQHSSSNKSATQDVLNNVKDIFAITEIKEIKL